MEIKAAENTGILLEGGAMRSIFSAGVLDFFMDGGIQIQNVLAVSAGAYAGMNYVSGQRGRVVETNIDYLKTEKYMGFRTFLRTGSFFDMELLFDKMPNELIPFDFEAFFRSAQRFITSTVSMKTGKAVYHDSFSGREELLRICRAANSLPLISRRVELREGPMLDGGMADAIPVKKALEEGWKKLIVVFTRDAAYRKKQRSAYALLIRLIYRRYPEFLKTVEERSRRYNESIELVNRLEKEGKAFVLRPVGLTVGNNESDVKKLTDYYKHGYEQARRRLPELQEFLREG